jgi:Flp pilus assembly pilin Flp
MGEAFQARRLSDAARRRAARRLAARPDLTGFLVDARGATAVEYAILVAVLSLALFAIFGQAQAVILATLIKAADAVEAAIS